MTLENLWTESGIRAWEYILSGVKQGLNATQALTQYRAGGGKIANVTWYGLYKNAFGLEGSAERWQDIPTTYTLPESFAIETGYDYRQEWVLSLELEGINPETRERYKRYVTVESDTRLTKGEYLSMAQEAIDMTPTSNPYLIERAVDVTFMRRVGIEV